MLTPGDLVFFRGDAHDPLDLAIMLRTRGNLVHVEVVYAAVPDGPQGARIQTIGALAGGITLHNLPTGAIPAATASRCQPALLSGALTWLRAQVGQPYGYVDIVDQAETLLDPDAPLVPSSHYDCSHLCGLFLQRAGYPLPAPLLSRPALISPVSLARAVGVQVAPPPNLLPFLSRVFPTGR